MWRISKDAMGNTNLDNSLVRGLLNECIYIDVGSALPDLQPLGSSSKGVKIFLHFWHMPAESGFQKKANRCIGLKLAPEHVDQSGIYAQKEWVGRDWDF